MAVVKTEVRFSVDVGTVPQAHLEDAGRKAREAFVLSLLRHGDISAGRAAEALGVNRWELGDVMSAYGISSFDDTRTREDLEREVAVAAGTTKRDPDAADANAEEARANAATIALLQSWIEEDATDDPEEIREAQRELDEFKRAINAERERAGARRMYP